MRNSILLLSGGIDSATLLAQLVNEGFNVLCLTFNYSQRHIKEVESAKAIASSFNTTHKIINIDPSSFVNSALLKSTDIPTNRTLKEIISNKIPSTYVSARNIIFLSYAVSWLEPFNSTNIFIGANKTDESGYPDCSRAFFDSFERMANLGTRIGLETSKGIIISSPFIKLLKHEIIELGLKLNVDYSQTTSCYVSNNENEACGKCDACVIRLSAFERVGMKDPITYRI